LITLNIITNDENGFNQSTRNESDTVE
jgi:hypothetical protein